MDTQAYEKLGKNEAVNQNQLDDLTDGLVNAMRYSNPEYEYLEYTGAKPDDGVPAEWFYPIHNGSNDFSELTAIHMYVTQEATFEDIGELMLGIGMTEMKHYDKLSDFITKLGGKIDQRFNNSGVTVGKTAVEALTIAIGAERETIRTYEEIQDKLIGVDKSKTREIALQLTTKLIADEKVHLNLLLERLELLDDEAYNEVAEED